MRLSLTVLALLLSAPALAEPPTIDADRPGFLFAGSTVPLGYAELEVGLPDFTASTNSGTQTDQAQFDALLRVGLLAGLELQLGQAWAHQETSSDEAQQIIDGRGDFLLGAKVSPPSWPSENLEATFVGQMTLPTGSPALSAGRVGFQLAGQLLWTFTGDQPLFQNVGALIGYGHAPSGDVDFSQTLTFAGSYGFAIRRNVFSYIEMEWQQPLAHADDALLAGAGIAWLPVRFLQLDAYFDRGLTKTSPQWLLGAGVSVLFPD